MIVIITDYNGQLRLLLSLFIRFPHLLGLSILTPEYAASKVVDAIEKNQTILMMPRGAYFSTALQQYVQQFDSHSNNRICLELTEKSLFTALPKQPKCKSEQMSLSILRKKNRLLLSKFFPPFLSIIISAS